jgi:uncharacterized protein YprB with RNaseH-like and TPR domain
MTNLSPDAQKVLDASMVHSGPAFETIVRRMLAAALRAAADQVVPLTKTPWNSTLISCFDIYRKSRKTPRHCHRTGGRMKLLFDIETNGLPRQGLDHIHCVVVKDIDTEEVFRFNDTGNSDSITNAITFLQEADVLIGHNIVGFDIPVIQGIYPFFNPKATLFDTLILSRMFFPDILTEDFCKRPIGMPAKAIR